jgi:hypothetical protein
VRTATCIRKRTVASQLLSSNPDAIVDVLVAPQLAKLLVVDNLQVSHAFLPFMASSVRKK